MCFAVLNVYNYFHKISRGIDSTYYSFSEQRLIELHNFLEASLNKEVYSPSQPSIGNIVKRFSYLVKASYVKYKEKINLGLSRFKNISEYGDLDKESECSNDSLYKKTITNEENKYKNHNSYQMIYEPQSVDKQAKEYSFSGLQENTVEKTDFLKQSAQENQTLISDLKNNKSQIERVYVKDGCTIVRPIKPATSKYIDSIFGQAESSKLIHDNYEILTRLVNNMNKSSIFYIFYPIPNNKSTHDRIIDTFMLDQVTEHDKNYDPLLKKVFKMAVSKGVISKSAINRQFETDEKRTSEIIYYLERYGVLSTTNWNSNRLEVNDDYTMPDFGACYLNKIMKLKILKAHLVNKELEVNKCLSCSVEEMTNNFRIIVEMSSKNNLNRKPDFKEVILSERSMTDEILIHLLSTREIICSGNDSLFQYINSVRIISEVLYLPVINATFLQSALSKYNIKHDNNDFIDRFLNMLLIIRNFDDSMSRTVESLLYEYLSDYDYIESET